MEGGGGDNDGGVQREPRLKVNKCRWKCMGPIVGGLITFISYFTSYYYYSSSSLCSSSSFGTLGTNDLECCYCCSTKRETINESSTHFGSLGFVYLFE